MIKSKWHVQSTEMWKSEIDSGWCDENTLAGKSSES